MRLVLFWKEKLDTEADAVGWGCKKIRGKHGQQ